MGKKGREIVQAKINVDEVIADLSKAYADEWCAHYQYWLAAHWVNGINADAVSSRLTTQSADELMHAERFANRIIELGGHPVMELGNIGVMPVALYPGMRICSFTFEQLSSPCEVSYKQKGKYSGQQGPAASKLGEEMKK